jgi:GYF domain 2
MSETLQVRVSREGKEIGTYPVQEAIRLLVYGTLKETDFYWHEGMTDWAPLTQLQASEARRQLAERALQQKQEEERKAAELVKKRLEEAEKLRQEKEEQDRLKEERIRAEVTRRKENFFTCNCCKARFEKPYDPRDLFWKGLGIIFLGFLAGAAVFGSATTGHGAPPGFIIFGLVVVSVVLTLWGSILVLSSGLRSPFCPGCHSTDYSRPNSDIRPVFE